MAIGNSAQLLARLARSSAGSLFARHGVQTWQELQHGLPCAQIAVRRFASDADLKKTPLYDFHVEHGGERITEPSLRDSAKR